MDSWEIIDTDRGALIRPKREFKCPFCGHNLVLHQFIVGFEPIKKFYHADVHLKCPECGFYVTFGVAISREDYERLLNSSLRGVDLTDELLEMDEIELSEEEEKLIKERLKLLGYWGG